MDSKRGLKEELEDINKNIENCKKIITEYEIYLKEKVEWDSKINNYNIPRTY